MLCRERPLWRSVNCDSTLRRPMRNGTESVPYRGTEPIRRIAR